MSRSPARPNSVGANPTAKVMTLLAGMVAGADSIDDLDRLRHAGNGVVFDQIQAPSTVGSFLRTFTHGHEFEELFTLGEHAAQDEARRRQFLDLLVGLAAAQPGERPVGVVVCALRSDFYTHCAGYLQLRAALQHNQIFVGPMWAAELRRAIEEPAADVGLRVESGLTELLLRDLGVNQADGATRDAYEAGRLPLLAFVLPALWRRRDGNRLTVESYNATGGIRDAVATAAESVFTGFNAEDQRIAKVIVLRLVKVGEGGPGEDIQRRRTMPIWSKDSTRDAQPRCWMP